MGIRVLIVDDSPMICELLTGIFASDPTFDVVGIANDPYEARELIKRLDPDVITLDIEMPRMDGLTFLRNLMRLRPMPVVMISSLTQRGSRETLEALDIGAFDFVGKPNASSEGNVALVQDEIRAKVKAAARAKVRHTKAVPGPVHSSSVDLSSVVIGLGASTGGTQALKHVLAELPPDAPPVLIVQHLPEAFSLAFAERLNSISPMTVQLAEDGQRLEVGNVYVAPGDEHLTVSGRGRVLKARVKRSEKVNLHRPAVDPLFESMAREFGSRCVAALLTGMGADGAAGMVSLRAAGAYTIAQDEASSVVWGMPGEAVKRDGAVEVVPLRRMTEAILRGAKKIAFREAGRAAG